MRAKVTALVLTGILACGGVAIAPAMVYGEEPSAATTAVADLTLPPNGVANDSLGDYSDPANPVDVEPQYSFRWNTYYAIDGVQYMYNKNNPSSMTAYVKDWQNRPEPSITHVPGKVVSICDTVNGLPVDSVTVDKPLDCLILGEQVREVNPTSYEKPVIGSIVIPSRELLSQSNNTDTSYLWLPENGKIYLCDGAERNDTLTMLLDEFALEQSTHANIRVHVQGPDGSFTHVNASDKNNIDNPAQSSGIAGVLPYIVLGTPEEPHATLAVDETGSFVFAVYEDHAELVYTAHLLYGASTKIENPVIPSHVDGKPVTVIGSKTFGYFDPFVGTVTIPSTVEEIGPNMFAGVTGGKGVTGIVFEQGCEAVVDPDAFIGCNNLVEVQIPPTVTVAGGGSIVDLVPDVAKPEALAVKVAGAGIQEQSLEVPFGSELLPELAKLDVTRSGYALAGWRYADGDAIAEGALLTCDTSVSPIWMLNAPVVSIDPDVEEPVEGDTVKLEAKVEHALLSPDSSEECELAYRWLKDGKPVDGAMGAMLDVTAPGSYTVEVTLSDPDGLTAQSTSAPLVVTFAAKPNPEPTPDPEPAPKPDPGQKPNKPSDDQGDSQDASSELPKTGDPSFMMVVSAGLMGAATISLGVCKRR